MQAQRLSLGKEGHREGLAGTVGDEGYKRPEVEQSQAFSRNREVNKLGVRGYYGVASDVVGRGGQSLPGFVVLFCY